MKIKIKYDRHGNVKKITGNVGQTRMNLAALGLWKGEIQPTFGYKLRRFFKRLFTDISAKAAYAATYHTVGSQAACEVPYICLEERTYEL